MLTCHIARDHDGPIDGTGHFEKALENLFENNDARLVPASG